MQTEPTGISGFEIVTTGVYPDSRGYFTELLRRDALATATGFDFDTAQVNASQSHAGVVRGFHYKQTPPGQAKFVSVLAGSIYDVALDLRPDSATFGQTRGVELKAGSGRSVLLAHGLAHAFLALEHETVIAYLNDTPYQPELEHAIQPHSVGVDWQAIANQHGIGDLIVSDRDLSAPTFAEIRAGIVANR